VIYSSSGTVNLSDSLGCWTEGEGIEIVRFVSNLACTVLGDLEGMRVADARIERTSREGDFFNLV
jgi:hypothetical protein